MRTHVDLFSGIGGFSLACEWAGVETIAFSEIDTYASRVLQRHWPRVRNYGDVRGLPKLSAWLLTAGVPCQPASVAGKRQGAADDRWLWPETLAVVENGSYEWLLFENPTGILSLNDGLEFERICASLESKGYGVQPLVIPACGAGALHRRTRVWVLAHSARQRFDGSGNRRPGRGAEPPKRRSDVSDANSQRLEIRQEQKNGVIPNPVNNGPHRTEGDASKPSSDWKDDRLLIGGDYWLVEPDVGRVANGIPARVDRLRGLGNAIVPQVAYQIIKRMIEAEDITLSANTTG